jgi:hypothetical protein
MRQSRTRWLSQVLEDKKRRNSQEETEREDRGKKGENGDFCLGTDRKLMNARSRRG